MKKFEHTSDPAPAPHLSQYVCKKEIVSDGNGHGSSKAPVEEGSIVGQVLVPFEDKLPVLSPIKSNIPMETSSDILEKKEHDVPVLH